MGKFPSTKLRSAGRAVKHGPVLIRVRWSRPDGWRRDALFYRGKSRAYSSALRAIQLVKWVCPDHLDVFVIIGIKIFTEAELRAHIWATCGPGVYEGLLQDFRSLWRLDA